MIDTIPAVLLKEIVHPKILLSLTQPYIIPNSRSFFCSGQKENCTGQVSKSANEKIKLKRTTNASIWTSLMNLTSRDNTF